MLAVVLIAQVSAASPTPTPTPPTSVAAVPRTLADLARERRLGQKGVLGGTFSVAGVPLSDPASAHTAPSPKGGRAPNGETAADAADARLKAARDTLKAATNAFWDEADQKGATSEALTPLRKKVEEAEQALEAAEAAAKRAR